MRFILAALAFVGVVSLPSCAPSDPPAPAADEQKNPVASLGLSPVDGGVCPGSAPPSGGSRLCASDADCPADGSCFDFRCYRGSCRAFLFQAGSPCMSCDAAMTCDEHGACVGPNAAR